MGLQMWFHSVFCKNTQAVCHWVFWGNENTAAEGLKVEWNTLIVKNYLFAFYCFLATYDDIFFCICSSSLFQEALGCRSLHLAFEMIVITNSEPCSGSQLHPGDTEQQRICPKYVLMVEEFMYLCICILYIHLCITLFVCKSCLLWTNWLTTESFNYLFRGQDIQGLHQTNNKQSTYILGAFN